MPPTALADWLRSMDDEALAALLRARPDLAVPSPPDSTVLATRAGIRASVARACEDLDAFTLAVLEALLVADADTAPVPLPDVDALLGPDVPPERTRQALGVLRERALAWGDDGAITAQPTVREVLTAHPGGLGRPVQTLAAAEVTAQLGQLAADELRVLQRLAVGPPIGRTTNPSATGPSATGPSATDTPVRRLLDRGLLLRLDSHLVELPRQVGLALRGNHPMGPVPVAEPALPTSSHQESIVDLAAVGEVLELLRGTENLIATWSAQPPPALRSGGLGTREMRRLGKQLGLDDAACALLVEAVASAGLVAATEGSDPEWVPTTLTDGWLAQSPEQRWATLAAAWLAAPRLPGLAGVRDDRDRLLAPLSDDLRRPLAARDRQWVLGTLAELPAGAGVTDRTALAGLLAWRSPRRGGRLRNRLIEWTLREATQLGVIARDAMTSFGRALLNGDRSAAVTALRKALPEPINRVLVQADLTVVAPGPLQPALAEQLAQVADVESAGSATVYRVSEPTVRRALDAGRSAAELHELFSTHSATPIPQAMSYLIDDVARRHGRLRAGTAGSFLRCDDAALLAEVLADRRTDAAALRRIAPTVLVSPRSLADLLDILRAAGFAPVAEGADGQVVTLQPAGRRIAARPLVSRHNALLGNLPPDRLTALIRQIRAGDNAASTRQRRAAGAATPTSTSATLALLQGAARSRLRVWIDYVDTHGVASHRIVEPVSVGGGVLEGFDHAHGGVRRFALHRITSAAVAE